MPTALGGPRAVTLGALPLDVVDDQGVTWVTTGLTGWRGSPATTLTVTQRPAADGGWASATPRLTPRQMEATIYVEAPDTASMTAAVDRLTAAVGTGAFTLAVTEDGRARQAVVYRNGDLLPTDDGGWWAVYSVPLIAPDPRRYGTVLNSLTLQLPSSSGGLVFPVILPFTIDAVTTNGDGQLGQAGTWAADPVVTVYGPVSQPSIVITPAAGTASTLTYGADIADGDWLVIDTGARSVLYNGTSTRRGLLQVYGGWPQIPPGGASAAFRAAAVSPTASAVITYRDTWM